MNSEKRTTVVLRPQDQENVSVISRLQGGIPDTLAIRQSLNLMRELLEFVKEQGGEVILAKGRRKERIRFI